MARRRGRFGRRGRRSGSRGLGSSNLLMKGLIGKMAPGILGLALAGAIGYFSPEISAAIPVSVPYKQPGVAALGGGAAGLGGMLLRGGGMSSNVGY